MDVEEWRPITGFSAYEVSSHGRVRRVLRARFGKPVPHEISLTNPKHGYHRACLTNDEGRKITCLVHRLVATAFLEEDPDRGAVAHNDGNMHNNHVSNLRWATQAENLADKVKHGTAQIGEKHPGAKMDDAMVREIRRSYTGRRGEITELSKKYGLSVTSMYHLVHGNTWRHV